MKLSEAISLGHTLIRETRDCFLLDGCGCAIGSAGAAHGLDGFFQVGGPIDWLHGKYPWTAGDWRQYPLLCDVILRRYAPCDYVERTHGTHPTVADLISLLHCRAEMPRLKIAELIAQIEPDEPVQVEQSQEAVTA